MHARQLTEHADGYADLGLTPIVAADWANRGFLPGEARPWIAEGFEPDVAARYADRFMSPQEAREELAVIEAARARRVANGGN